MRRILIGVAAFLGLVILAAGIAFFTVDINRFKPRIEAMASEMVGRPVRLDGPLELSRGWTMRLRAQDVHLGNADWAQDEDMTSAQSVEVSFDLWQLLTRRTIALPEVKVSGAELNLERNAKGEANWDLPLLEAAEPEQRGEIPWLGHVALADSRLRYRDAQMKLDLVTEIDQAEVKSRDKDSPVELQLAGTFEDQKLNVQGQLGSWRELARTTRPFPVDLKVQLAEVATTLQGTIAKPATFEGIDLALSTDVKDLAGVLAKLGIDTGPLPDFALDGQIRHEGEEWRADNLKGQVGGIELSGGLAFSSAGERPRITGELQCRELKQAQLTQLLGGGDGKEAPARTDDGQIIPNAKLPTNLPQLDVAVDLRCRRFETAGLGFTEPHLQVKLENGKLRVDPVQAGFLGGQIQAQLGLDTTDRPPRSELALSGHGLSLRELLGVYDLAEHGAGLIALRGNLAGQGGDLRSLLGSAQGRVALTMEDGKVDVLPIEALGLDLGEILAVLLGGKDIDLVDIRCFVADLQLESGTAFLKTFVLDTSDSVITAEGALSLATEEINLVLEAHPKDASLLAARTPIKIQGRLGHLEVGTETTELVARGAAATVLGLIATPLGALIPFIEPGEGKDTPCRALLARAQTPSSEPDKGG